MGVDLEKGPTVKTEFKTKAEEDKYNKEVLAYRERQAKFRAARRDNLIELFNFNDETQFLKWEAQLPDVAPKSADTGPVRPRSINPKNVHKIS
jgi:hypothetical protein